MDTRQSPARARRGPMVGTQVGPTLSVEHARVLETSRSEVERPRVAGAEARRGRESTPRRTVRHDPWVPPRLRQARD